MISKFAGSAFVVLFCVSQAFRDVYFANAFQGVSFFAVIIIAFSIAIAMFGAATFLRDPEQFVRLRGEIPALIWMNLLTAIAWTSYFFSLKYLQPSIVNTLHSGAGPLTVVVLASFGIHIARPSPMRRVEYIGYLGIAASLLFLWWVALADRSGLRMESQFLTIASLALPIVSGTAITASSLWTKQLHERGIGADTVTAVRYILIVAVACCIVLVQEKPTGIENTHQFVVLALLATLLIVLPLYALQLGISRTAPLTTHTIRALGPVLVFGAELIDGRVSYSGPALLGIAAYSLFVIASNVARGWQDDVAIQSRGGPTPAVRA